MNSEELTVEINLIGKSAVLIRFSSENEEEANLKAFNSSFGENLEKNMKFRNCILFDTYPFFQI